MNQTKKTNRKGSNEKLVFVSGLATLIFFSILILINYLKIDGVIVSVFRELFTIPFLLALLVLFPFASVLLFKTERKIGSMPFWALLCLLATVLLLILNW